MPIMHEETICLTSAPDEFVASAEVFKHGHVAIVRNTDLDIGQQSVVIDSLGKVREEMGVEFRSRMSDADACLVALRINRVYHLFERRPFRDRNANGRANHVGEVKCPLGFLDVGPRCRLDRTDVRCCRAELIRDLLLCPSTLTETQDSYLSFGQCRLLNWVTVGGDQTHMVNLNRFV
jgi:hypothetical protein